MRLVYLAVLNIFKHRGNFLNSSLSVENTTVDMTSAYRDLRIRLVEYTDISLPVEFNEVEFRKIMCVRGKSRTKKYDDLRVFFKIGKNEKEKCEILKAIAGMKFTANVIFPLETEEKQQICFYESGYEDKLPEIEAFLGDEYASVLACMKQIYDGCAWDTVMSGYQYLSDARVDSYRKHKADLKKLKEVFQRYKTHEEYDRFFRTDEAGTYGDYVGSNNTGTKQRRRGQHSRDEFYKAVKKELKDIDDEIVSEILNDIELNTFMPKQLTSANGIIPYQAHSKELRVILANASEYLPFLKKIDPESNESVMEEIVDVFEFRIPYYVGPVTENSQKHGGNGWVVRKEAGPIRPWNIENKIDIAKTSEAFIQRMVRQCTYISGAKVLPKSSLLYERFSVLNELNNICIDGERIVPELKQDIYNALFTGGKVVTRNKIANYLINRGIIHSADQISGIDIRVNSQLSSYYKFYQIFGEEMKKDSCGAMVEDIIYLSTIFGDEKKFLREQLQKKYGDKLEGKLKKILALKFRDWGKLSREFLELRGCNKDTGEILTLTQALWETSFNMMELINSDRFGFMESLRDLANHQVNSLSEFTFEDLNEMYFSAPVKRMVWQTLQIIRELEHILGTAPDRVFIEMTRNEEEKKRTVSRTQQLLELYNNEDDSWKEIIQKADESKTLRSKKMYLYLKQKGIDLYTGKPISLDDLFHSGKYDIDHIYPQSLTKDDNLDNNMVLTDKTVNNHKQDTYPLDESIRRKMAGTWYSLHERKFINDEKYRRLTGHDPLTEDQLAGFIARQLVETSQGTKAVADILKIVLPGTKIIYSKAKTVSDFRQRFSIFKCRSLNDLHHAHDAYLNIVVGNTYYVKFTDNPYRFIRDRYEKNPAKYRYNLARLFDYDVSNGKET